MWATVPLLWVAACGLAVAVDGACNASSCIFRYVCDESPNLGCCLNGTRSAGCDNNPGFCTDAHCGQVDAAPSIPKSLFKPENADKLALYISFTSGIQIKDPFCEFKQRGPQGSGYFVQNPRLGTCADADFKYKHANEPGRTITWGGFSHGKIDSPLSPTGEGLLQAACIAGCACCVNASVLFSPQYEAQCSLPKGPKSLPQCGDGLRPGQEDWCTVCGPTP